MGQMIRKGKRFVINSLVKVIGALLSERIMGKRYFRYWESRGYHVTPVHFYSPIPDTRTLPRKLWSKPSELPGIDLNERVQLKLLSLFASQFKSEYTQFPSDKPSKPCVYYFDNRSFKSVDGELLYCMIRYFKPQKIIEIGSGYSTFLSAQAIMKNVEEDKHYDCELVAIDPYPNTSLKAGFPGLSRLISREVQEVRLSEFRALSKSDFLFIDSSHVLKIGGDVQYEYLEILPRLSAGVIVHVHDIFLPSEYPKEWIFDMNRFWNEQYLLQSFLAFNQAFEVLLAASYLALKHRSLVNEAFPYYRGQQRLPGSFWMRKK